MKPSFFLSTLLILTFSFFSCKSEVEAFNGETITDYIPLQEGKYITYRLDSTVFPNAGRSTEVHSYHEKNVVDAPIVDNMGRPGYRVFRYLRDTAGLKPWASAGSYSITVLDKSVEVYDNNLRTIPLIAPIKEGATWIGNRYLGDDPYRSLYNFTSVDNNDLSDWEYTYSSIGSESIGAKAYDNVVTVYHKNEMQNEQNNRPRIDTVFASRTLSLDKYAKSVGLVFQERIMWEYQPNLTGPSAYRTGFGVKRTLIEHN
ncbi:MAG TPA: hypothetical protein VM888_02575 [Chitinophagaceae bacterium]|nr:hypothetical protein [Chitinophagaceae bacterium]